MSPALFRCGLQALHQGEGHRSAAQGAGEAADSLQPWNEGRSSPETPQSIYRNEQRMNGFPEIRLPEL